MTSTSGDQPQTISAERDAATLAELRAEYPDLTIGIESAHGSRVWVAQGKNGRPWLVLSSDLGRFRAALGQP